MDVTMDSVELIVGSPEQAPAAQAMGASLGGLFSREAAGQQQADPLDTGVSIGRMLVDLSQVDANAEEIGELVASAVMAELRRILDES
jgi:hypothetical protein